MGLQQEKITLAPSIMWEKNSQPVDKFDLEVASFFALTEFFRTTHEKLKNTEYTYFSKALWPITLVQNGPEDYIVIDGLNFYLFQFSLTISPNTIQSKISRTLRDSGYYGHPGAVSLEEFLKNLITSDDLLKDIEKEEKTIKGMIEPDVIKGLSTILKIEDQQPVNTLAVIDSAYSTDEVLVISERFREFYNQIQGNINKWKELDELIVSITDVWLINLMKDIEDKEKNMERDIRRKETEAKGAIPDLEHKKSGEFFDLTEESLKKRKKLSKEVIEGFRPILRYFEEIKNNYSKIAMEEDPEEIILQISNLFGELSSNKKLDPILSEFKNNLNSNETSLKELEDGIRKKENEINEKYKKLESEVGTDLPQMKENLQKQLSQHKNMRLEFENLVNSIRNHITRIISNCENEKNYLKRWTITGKEVNLVMPISKIYVPLYFAELEDEDGEEKFIIIPPIIIPREISLADRWVPFEFISSSFSPLIKDRLETVLENNFELRSKFEFSCENKNLLTMEDMDRRVNRGFDLILREKLMDELHLNEVKKNWNKFREKLKNQNEK